MHRPAALLPVALTLALGVIISASSARAQEQDARERGPIKIDRCQTIDQPGSYKLADNLTFSGPANGTCLSITANFVTIDLAGFTISWRGPQGPGNSTTAIGAGNDTTGIAVRNGAISGFGYGVALEGGNSIVEGVRAVEDFDAGITITSGIVKGNIVSGSFGLLCGINATGAVVTGNYVSDNRDGICVGAGSTVIGNTVLNGHGGIIVTCPSNVTDNTTINNFSNLGLNGTGCNSTNNVAP